jgi:hypothetical protein
MARHPERAGDMKRAPQPMICQRNPGWESQVMDGNRVVIAMIELCRDRTVPAAVVTCGKFRPERAGSGNVYAIFGVAFVWIAHNPRS